MNPSDGCEIDVDALGMQPWIEIAQSLPIPCSQSFCRIGNGDHTCVVHVELAGVRHFGRYVHRYQIAAKLLKHSDLSGSFKSPARSLDDHTPFMDGSFPGNSGCLLAQDLSQ